MGSLNLNIVNNITKQENLSVLKLPDKLVEQGNSSISKEQDIQKVYANNLPSLGISFKGLSLSKIKDKAKIDENADKLIEKFCKFLNTKTPEDALKYTLNAISNKNFSMVEALSINIRTFDAKMEKLKNIIGADNFELQFLPAFKEHYKKYLESLWNNKNVSLEEMITLRPDWSFSKVQKKVDFKQPFTLGKLPDNFATKDEFNKLCEYLTKQAAKHKEETKNIPDFCINNKIYKITRFTDGVNKEGVFLVEKNGKKYVIKTNKTSYIDSESLENSSPDKAYPSRAVFVDKYLSNNNCKNVPKLYFYEFNPLKKRNRTVYEYIESNADVNPTKVKLKDMEALKVLFQDTYGTNNILIRDGIPKCVDNDDSSVNLPFSLFVWGYNFTKGSALSMFHL